MNDWTAYGLIITLGLVTYATRIGGHLVLSRFSRLNPRLEADYGVQLQVTRGTGGALPHPLQPENNKPPINKNAKNLAQRFTIEILGQEDEKTVIWNYRTHCRHWKP